MYDRRVYEYERELNRDAFSRHRPDQSTARLSVNADKNRYANILPSESQSVDIYGRVKLSGNREDGSDYINASHLYTGGMSFIGCQAPTLKTVADFWRMVWEHDVQVIVMLTKLIERGMVKADPYWPSRNGFIGASQVHDHAARRLYFLPFTVEALTDEEAQVSFGDRAADVAAILDKGETINVEALRLKNGHQSRIIYHVHDLGWPDGGVPDQADSTILCKQLCELLNSNPLRKGQPMVVHCSAGVGRTGTFVAAFGGMGALDELCLQFNVGTPGHLPTAREISGCLAAVAPFLKQFSYVHLIRSMREQRHRMMVQTRAQYLFLYRILLAYAKNLIVHLGALLPPHLSDSASTQLLLDVQAEEREMTEAADREAREEELEEEEEEDEEEEEEVEEDGGPGAGEDMQEESIGAQSGNTTDENEEEEILMKLVEDSKAEEL